MRGYRARCVALTGVCSLVFVTLGLAGLGSPSHPNAANGDGGEALVAVQLEGRSALAVRGSDLQSTIPPAVMARVARTWPRVPGSRPATVVGGAALGSWLWWCLTRRKARGPEPRIIWREAAGPRGPPVTLSA